MDNPKTVAFLTLGCKLNYAETATIARDFVQHGYTLVSPSKPAGVYVVNTCSVTGNADKKCRQAIRKLIKVNPRAVVAVTGCYAQLRAPEIQKIPGVSLVLGTNYRHRIVEAVETGHSFTCSCEELHSIFPAFSAVGNTRERTRSFLKVQDGCDYRCSYCTVPLARGGSRNIPIALAVEQAQTIAAAGVKEIVLTGVNTGDFGKTTGETFFDLLKALEEVQGIERYRISSIEPNLLTTEIIAWLAEHPKFQHHFHIPLQSGSDNVLKRMRRRYTTGLFAERLQYIRTKMPYAFIGVDVIVGFPGETEEDFETTCRFLEEVRPAFLHIFPYSVRPGTQAALFPVSERVAAEIQAERVHKLGQLSDILHESFCRANSGRREKVLFEGKTLNGIMHGYTGNYIRVEREYDKSLINTIVEVTLD
ncbi:MAG: tRNA (N(6)-L-threonylcarbamoyladenosine(37)-C(2))-methylthiotransferase MtaB [Bacteroidales bacterium]